MLRIKTMQKTYDKIIYKAYRTKKGHTVILTSKEWKTTINIRYHLQGCNSCFFAILKAMDNYNKTLFKAK